MCHEANRNSRRLKDFYIETKGCRIETFKIAIRYNSLMFQWLLNSSRGFLYSNPVGGDVSYNFRCEAASGSPPRTITASNGSAGFATPPHDQELARVSLFVDTKAQAWQLRTTEPELNEALKASSVLLLSVRGCPRPATTIDERSRPSATSGLTRPTRASRRPPVTSDIQQRSQKYLRYRERPIPSVAGYAFDDK
jgi:hypothetical protein